MNYIYDIITDKRFTYHQKIFKLAMEAESTLKVLNISDKTKDFLNKEIICEMFEGNAPYRPRYTMPDYQKFIDNGSDFLGLKPPENLLEAVNSLLILYKHIPSITSFPVYLGQLDNLLEKFVIKENEEMAYNIIKMFLIHLDRTLTDSFVHANIGPKKTKTGELILKIEKELGNAVPNLSLKYNNETPDDFALLAIDTGLAVSKPYFINDDIFCKEFKEGYGISSCYNTLPLGGGSFTLVRLNLKKIAENTNDINSFKSLLKESIYEMNNYMEERIKFLVEKSNFFNSSFLVDEGLLDLNKFTAMFGIFGMAECINILFNSKETKIKFGDAKTIELTEEILKIINSEINNFKSNYCDITNNHFLLHAQSGITNDIDVSPGVRLPVGNELNILDHILFTSNFHKYFPAGISDIFVFDKTVKQNMNSILDVIKGALKKGLRIFSFYCSDSDLIRITGFLVKKSEVEKFKQCKPALHDTVSLGIDAFKNANILNRKIRNNV